MVRVVSCDDVAMSKRSASYAVARPPLYKTVSFVDADARKLATDTITWTLKK